MLRAKVEGGNNDWDVVQVESEELALGCEEGLFEKLDWAKLGGKDDFLPAAVHDCGVGAIVWSTSCWPTTATSSRTAPKTWADFWDVKKFPGKRGMRKGPKTNLEFALMADGVAPGDVYKVLATTEPASSAPSGSSTSSSRTSIWWEAGAAAAAAPRLRRRGDDHGL